MEERMNSKPRKSDPKNTKELEIIIHKIFEKIYGISVFFCWQLCKLANTHLWVSL